VDGAQVCADGVTRRCVGPESFKLRVMAIAFGRAPKDRSSKQRLTPQGHKPLRIEIAGMNRPQSHWCLTFDTSGDRLTAKPAVGRPLDGRVRRHFAEKHQAPLAASSTPPCHAVVRD
jgi:hypothetical protein